MEQPKRLFLVRRIVGVAFRPDHAVEGGVIAWCERPTVLHPLDQVWVCDVRGTEGDQVMIAVLQLGLCQLRGEASGADDRAFVERAEAL